MPPKKIQEIFDKQAKHGDMELFFGAYMKENNAPFPGNDRSIKNTFGLTAARTALHTAVICKLFQDGHSFAEIMDGSKIVEERKKAAKDVITHFKNGKSDDGKWFCDIYTGGCKKIIDLFDSEIPKLAKEKPTAIFDENHLDAFYAMTIIKDVSQEMSRFKDIYDQEHGEGAMAALKNRKENSSVFFETTNQMVIALNEVYTMSTRAGLDAKKSAAFGEYMSMFKIMDQYTDFLKANPDMKISEMSGVKFAEVELLIKMSASLWPNRKKVDALMKDSNADQVALGMVSGKIIDEAGLYVELLDNNMYTFKFDKFDEYRRLHPAYDIKSEASAKFEKDGKEKIDQVTNAIKTAAEGFKKGGDYAPANPNEAMSRLLAEYFYLDQVYSEGVNFRFQEDIVNAQNKLENEKAIAELRNSDAFKNFMKTVTPERFASLVENGKFNEKQMAEFLDDYRDAVTADNDKKLEEERKAIREGNVRRNGAEAVGKMIKEDVDAMKNISSMLKETDPDKQLADPEGAKMKAISSAFAHHVLKNAIEKTPDVSVVKYLLEPDTIKNSIADLEKSPKLQEFINSKITDEAFEKIAEEGEEAVSKMFTDFVSTLKAPEHVNNDNNERAMPEKEDVKEMDEQVLQ